MKRIVLFTITAIFCTLNLMGQAKQPAHSFTDQPKLLAESIVRGKIVYSASCLPCHQADGGGVQGLNPPLIKTDYVIGDQIRLINIILKGFNEEVEIDGEIYSNPMPPMSGLTDKQIADVLTYVRNNFQNKASAITESQVKAVREKK